MIAALIALASVLAYLGCLVFSARWTYQRIRPWTEPLACDSRDVCAWKGKHYNSCYIRFGEVETANGAIALSTLFGLLGPISFILLVGGKLLRAAITSGTPLTQKELEAKVARLEKELGMGGQS